MNAVITIKDGKITVAEQVGDTLRIGSAGESAAVYPINPATGKPSTGVPGYVSELAGLLTGTHSTDPVIDTTTYDNKPPRSFVVRPGDTLPMPNAGETILIELEHPLGIASYEYKVPAGFTGKGNLKGRGPLGGDDFAVAYSLGLFRGNPEGPTVGSMELPINFDATELDGYSNTPAGFRGWLNLNNVAGKPITLQFSRA